MIGSMSAARNPHDDAQVESLMKTRTAGEVYLGGREEFTDVTARLPRSIDHVYNVTRMHSAQEKVDTKHSFSTQQYRC